MSRISIRKTSHMSTRLQVTLTDYAGNKSHLSLSQQPLVGNKVKQAKAKDSPKRPGNKEESIATKMLGSWTMESPSKFMTGGWRTVLECAEK